MLTMDPKTPSELDEEPRFLEFDVPAADLSDDSDVVSERERYDDQIIAALVCP
jgi:hypothetical protein